jgi:hypothetical protein
MLTRLRGVVMAFVTAIDDVIIERFWKRLRRGEIAPAFRVLGEIAVGWWGCTATILFVVLLTTAVAIAWRRS